MSFDKLKAAILTEADNQATAIRKRYDSQYQIEKKRIKADAANLEETMLADAKHISERVVHRLHQEHQLAAKAHILEAKQAELEKARQHFIDSLLESPAADQKKLLTQLLKQLPTTPGTIIASKKHQALLENLAGKTPHTLSDDTLNTSGGFVYKGQDLEMNLTFDHLTKRLFAKYRALLAGSLFNATLK